MACIVAIARQQPSHSRYFALMACRARLSWLLEQVHAGRNVCVSFSYNADLRREKIKFVLDDALASTIATYRPCIFSALWSVAAAMEVAVVTDKGHKASSGRCVVEFWIRQPGAPSLESQFKNPPQGGDVTMSQLPEIDNEGPQHVAHHDDLHVHRTPPAADPPPNAMDTKPGADVTETSDSLDKVFGGDGVGTNPSVNHACSPGHARGSFSQADAPSGEVDVPCKSWDRKRFRTLHERHDDESISDKVWNWISERYVMRFGKTCMNCEKKLEALSERELLATMCFLKSGDELDLAVPFFTIRRVTDVESAPAEKSVEVVTSDQSLDQSHAGGIQLAGINKRGMAQPTSKRKKR